MSHQVLREDLRTFLQEHAGEEMEKVDPKALNTFLDAAAQSLNVVGELKTKGPAR